MSDAQLRALSRSLGIRDRESIGDLHFRLTLGLMHYRWAQERSRSHPTWQQVGAAAKVLQNLAATLAKKLREIDDHTARSLRNSLHGVSLTRRIDLSIRQPPKGQRLASGNGIADLTSDLEYLTGCLAEIVRYTPRARKGRKRNDALEGLIWQLSEIYLQFCGTSARRAFSYSSTDKTYGGPFVIFASECIARIDPALKLSNNALGEQIRRALGWRK